jgi:hypothetical protein
VSERPAPVAASSSAHGECPLCRGPLFGWVSVPAQPSEAGVGIPLRERPEDRILDRCESCGVAVEQGASIDPVTEWRALGGVEGESIAVPNRASLQAALGEGGWAGLAHTPGRLVLTPRGLELLAARAGAGDLSIRFPPFGRSQAWMWQTLLNGLTFHANFPSEARSGRLRPTGAVGQVKFAIDAAVTVLAAPLVALASVPLELAGALIRRGGMMVARAEATAASSSADAPRGD